MNRLLNTSNAYQLFSEEPLSEPTMSHFHLDPSRIYLNGILFGIQKQWGPISLSNIHEKCMIWKRFRHYKPFVSGFDRPPKDSLKSQQYGTLIFLWCYREQPVKQTVRCRRFETSWRSCDVIVILIVQQHHSYEHSLNKSHSCRSLGVMR